MESMAYPFRHGELTLNHVFTDLLANFPVEDFWQEFRFRGTSSVPDRQKADIDPKLLNRKNSVRKPARPVTKRLFRPLAMRLGDRCGSSLRPSG
jgi:hypothetical protein